MTFQMLEIETIPAMDGAIQLKILADAAQELASLNAQLAPHYEIFAACKDIDETMAAMEATTPETRNLLERSGKAATNLENLRYLLACTSQDMNVRAQLAEELQPEIDALIYEQFIFPKNPGKHYWHNLLFLSQFGGRLTCERPDAWHLAYEFNAETKQGPKIAVAWNPMEILFEAGLTKVYAEKTPGNNLTRKGEMVLARLTARFSDPAVKENLVLAA